LLDDFNRANGSIGANWSGNTANYAINTNLLAAINASGGPIYWNGGTYDADQEASMTLSVIQSTSDELGLLLKVQSGNTAMIDVLYNSVQNRVEVWTYASSSWTLRGTISGSYSPGQVLRARARPTGVVEVYRNGTLIGSVNVSAWPNNAQGGGIGIWVANTTTSRIDNFSGGNVCP
jgi:hypothetical protein